MKNNYASAVIADNRGKFGEINGDYLWTDSAAVRSARSEFRMIQ